MMHARVPCVVLLLAAAAVAGAAPAHAQSEDWLAWQGCWRGEGAPAGQYLCVVPAGDAGVQLLTVAGGAIVGESRVFTDGRARAVQTDGCTGSEAAFWSADGQRVFLRSELSCENGVVRDASGMFVITGSDSWLSVQAVTIDGRTATRSVRYDVVADAVAPANVRAALDRSESARIAARLRALAPVDGDDVNEAVDRIDGAAVQEWLAATDQPFQLADDVAAASGDVLMSSALDHAAQYTSSQTVREVVHVVERPVIVERPVYVQTHTHSYDYRYRTCWDPFFAGVVIGLGRASIALGSTHCGRSYSKYHSPWGYDLYGWRIVDRRPIIIAGRPIIHRREPPRRPKVVIVNRDYDRYSPPSRFPTGPVPAQPTRTAKPRYETTLPTRTTQPRNETTLPTRTTQPRNETTLPTRTTQPRTEPTTLPTRTAAPRDRTPPAGPLTTTVRPGRPTVTTPPQRVDTRPTQPQRTAQPPQPAPTRRAVPAVGRSAPPRTPVPSTQTTRPADRKAPPASPTTVRPTTQPATPVAPPPTPKTTRTAKPRVGGGMR